LGQINQKVFIISQVTWDKPETACAQLVPAIFFLLSYHWFTVEQAYL